MSNSSAPPNSEVPTARQRPRGLFQAPIEPVDDSGVGAFRAGTLAFAVATVVLFALRNRLDEVGRGWWLGVALAGTVIGLVGLWWTRRRARRLALDQSSPARADSARPDSARHDRARADKDQPNRDQSNRD